MAIMKFAAPIATLAAMGFNFAGDTSGAITFLAVAQIYLFTRGSWHHIAVT